MAIKKTKKKAGSSKFVVCLNIDFVERKFDDEEWPKKKKLKVALETINDFINELKDKLEGGISDRILISNPEEFFIDDLEVGLKKIEYFDGVQVYLLVTKSIPAEELDSLFLEMDDYGFYANYPNDNGEIIVQGYDKGEYDTGYFAAIAEGDPDSWDPENYRATENIDGVNGLYLYRIYFPYNIAKDILLNKLKVNDHVEVNDHRYVKSYCEKTENLTNNSETCRGIASTIAEKISDKEWAKKVYKKAEKKAGEFKDYCDLAQNIYEDLGDKEWAKKVYKKSEDLAESSEDLRDLAESIAQKIGDKEWTKKVYKKSEKITTEYSDFIYLADSINEQLNDKKWVKAIYEKLDFSGEDFSLLNDLACEIYEKLGDKEWAKRVYKNAEENAENSDEYESLAESIRENLGDKKWAKLLDKKAKELEEENDDEDDD